MDAVEFQMILDEKDHHIDKAQKRRRFYEVEGDYRSAYIQSMVVDRLLDERAHFFNSTEVSA